jgi:hypothetical protein
LHLIRECPKTLVTQFSTDAIQLYSYHAQSNNALPDRGGVNQQLALVMEAFAVIRDESIKVQKVRMEEEEEKNKKKQKNTAPRGVTNRG